MHKIKLASGEIVECVNEDKKFWKHYFVAHLANIGGPTVYVNADHEQDALDYAVDYAEQMKWEGYLLDESDPEIQEADERGEILRAGNHGRMINGDETHIERLRGVKRHYESVTVTSGRVFTIDDMRFDNAAAQAKVAARDKNALYIGPETWRDHVDFIEALDLFHEEDIYEVHKYEWFKVLDNAEDELIDLLYGVGDSDDQESVA